MVMKSTDGHERERSAVAMHDDLESIWSEVRSASRVMALTHANPDGDAVASLLAITEALIHAGKEVLPAVGDGELPDTLRFLPGTGQLMAPNALKLDGIDLLFVVDCADLMRLGPIYREHEDWFSGTIPIVNVDHHITNTRFGRANLVDPVAAATCEVLTTLLQEVGVPIDADLATCLLTGIQGDTLGLRTPSTTSRTLRVSADLLELGADLDTIVDHLFRVKPFSTIKLWGLALDRAEQMGEVVWTEITEEMLRRSRATAAEGEGIVNFLTGSKGARVGILFYEQPDGWRVSMRSVREDVDVAQLAARYGGGGHSRAAGCRLSPGAEARDSFLADISASVARQAESV